MKEQLFENPVELRSAVPTPNFDDRRVMLRAQPVVPLDEIRTRQTRRRLWFLSGAFAVALVLGAASALVAVQIKRIAANNQTAQIEEPESATAEAQTLPVQTDSIANSMVGEEVEPEKPTITVPSRPAPLAQQPRIANRDRETLTGREGVQPSEDEQLEQIREAVLYEQWQERRQRRAERRERRNRGDRDLSHLDEIFEGRRRSERP